SLRLGVRHGICVAKMLDNTQSIICAFGLAAAAPRSPYRHLELCGIALKKYTTTAAGGQYALASPPMLCYTIAAKS
ncbi:hypothetical protein, partial [Gemmiger formicilis]|uniref:hypothetical protein n=1 Tax=Gemmiger formicilis TaxID=745368 RepID=UPI003AB85A05